jgi:uncharacterized membrane protein
MDENSPKCVEAWPVQGTMSDTPVRPCVVSRGELVAVLETHGADSSVYRAYFRASPADDGTVVCAACGLHIGRHPQSEQQEATARPPRMVTVEDLGFVSSPFPVHQDDRPADDPVVSACHSRVLLAFCVTALLFTVVAMATPVATVWHQPGFKDCYHVPWVWSLKTLAPEEYTQWYARQRVRHMAGAIIAFILFTFIAIAVAVAVAVKITRAGQRSRVLKFIMVGSSTATCVFSIITWALSVNIITTLYYSEHRPRLSEEQLRHGYHWGPAPFMLVVVSVASLVMIVTSIRL